MKKIIILLLFSSSVLAQETRSYNTITDRNAFALLDKEPAKVELPKLLQKPPVKLYLTGIINFRGTTNVYLYSKDIEKRFITLNSKRRTDSGITLLSVDKGLVELDNNGVVEMLSFESHRLPSVKTSNPTGKPTIVKKDSKSDKDKKISPPTPRPAVVTVPSRNRSITDPRMQSMMERGLEYLNKIDDPKKKEAMLERLEKFQRGDYDKEIKDRMKRYEDYRKNRERKSDGKKR